MNRAIHGLNHALDKAILQPVPSAYTTIIPKPVRGGAGNFFSNIGELNTMLNDCLQGKWGHGVNDGARFLINSTIGIGAYSTSRLKLVRVLL